MERDMLLKEIDDILPMRQYFWRAPVMPPVIYGQQFSFANKANMVKQIQADCLTELNRWRGKIETDPDMYDIVKEYWVNGVGYSQTGASTIIKERKSDVVNKANEIRHPWSAAFVSFIMRKTYPQFLKSTAHNRYIQWAKDNRKTGAHPFQAFKVSEVSVEAGDIICFARDKKNWASYEHVAGKFTHGDIVISVQNGFATTIGGNVNKNVEQKTNKFKLDSNGVLEQEYITINKKSLPKFIAIIKLLPYYQKGYMIEDNFDILPMRGNEISFDGQLNREFETTIPCGSAGWQTIKKSFKTQTWAIADGEDGKAFQEKMYKVLRKAGQNPDDWFKNFTRVSFLGRSFNNPIHTELATHLKIVEDNLLTYYGIKDPKKLGDGLKLTNESLKGGRRESQTASVSMHTFGLAMDINYYKNPYLGGTVSNKNTLLGLEKAGYIKIGSKKSFNKLDILDKIFERMGLLFNGYNYGSVTQYPRGYTFDTRLDLYDKLSDLSKMTINYFNLVDNPSALDVLLKKEQSVEWYKVTLTDALATINQDFDWFRGLVSRYSIETKDAKTGQKIISPDLVIKKSGFLNLDRRLVDKLGLDWGATYGDIMHFDMRNKCIGKTIADSR